MIVKVGPIQNVQGKALAVPKLLQIQVLFSHNGSPLNTGNSQEGYPIDTHGVYTIKVPDEYVKPGELAIVVTPEGWPCFRQNVTITKESWDSIGAIAEAINVLLTQASAADENIKMVIDRVANLEAIKIKLNGISALSDALTAIELKIDDLLNKPTNEKDLAQIQESIGNVSKSVYSVKTGVVAIAETVVDMSACLTKINNEDTLVAIEKLEEKVAKEASCDSLASAIAELKRLIASIQIPSLAGISDILDKASMKVRVGRGEGEILLDSGAMVAKDVLNKNGFVNEARLKQDLSKVIKDAVKDKSKKKKPSIGHR